MIKKKKKEKTCPTYAMPSSGQGVPKITSLRLALGGDGGLFWEHPSPGHYPTPKELIINECIRISPELSTQA